MHSPSLIQTGDSSLDAYLLWRRKTRLLRKYGGPVIAIGFTILAAALLWQMGRTQPVDDPTEPLANVASDL
ncbi:MAG: hypothetical protein JNM99_19560 [Verrucomicrobiaceae bacterium]|nr:hypothetical protein [Verrucomicrobiaceae bacterium]